MWAINKPNIAEISVCIFLVVYLETAKIYISLKIVRGLKRFGNTAVNCLDKSTVYLKFQTLFAIS